MEFPSLCRVLEKTHSLHHDEKREQKFERVKIDLLQSGSWMEKVLRKWNFATSSLTSSINFHQFSVIFIFVSNSILQVVRLHLLLTVKESAINVPMNLEARRRITFFANSLFMIMPSAPKVRNMLSFRLVFSLKASGCLFTESNFS